MICRWWVPCGALLVGTSLVAVAWSQGTSSLAERIQQLRRGWAEDDSRESSAATLTPGAGASSAAATAPTQPRGLPHIDARSLMPTNLFGRPGANAGDDDQATTPVGGQPPAVVPRAGSVTTSPTGMPPRTGSAQGDNSLSDGFTLPGLGSPLSTASRPAGTPTPSSGDAPQVVRVEPIKPPTGSQPRVLPDAPAEAAVSTASSSDPVRRSPQSGPTIEFDPEALRNELAGAFPTPADAADTSSRDSLRYEVGATGDVRKEKPATTATPKLQASASADENDAPSSTGPIPLPSRVEPSDQESDPWHAEPRPTFSSSSDRYQQPAAAPIAEASINTADSDTGTSATRAAGPAGSVTLNADSDAAKAFQASSESRPAAQDAPTTVLSPFGAQAERGDIGRREQFADADSTGPAASGVLVASQAPVVTSDMRGPKQITIGREASYRLRLRNQGTVSAEQLVASVRIPSWAEVVNMTASQGMIRQGDDTETTGTLEWHLTRLDAQAAETLTIDLIPRASRPLELGLTWSYAPVGGRAVVEVQEPKLQMQITGPDEVLYGKPNSYRLTLSNPGTGVAENVKIDLLPPGGGRQSVSTHSFGELSPGASKTVEVELTAREAGKLSVEALASAEGGLVAQATKELFCRKPELEVDWRGPELQYSGTPATYFFRARNPGTATAENIVVHASLPAGAEFLFASEGHVHDAVRREVVWRVGSLGPGDDCYLELRCVVHTPGENQLRISAATADSDLSDEKLAVTNVVALADLKLEVSDPPGPVPVGEEAVYEIRVRNRGASAAEDVSVVGLFSAGLEPESGEGAPYDVADGRVSFRTIRRLPAGQSILLQIRARATKAGTHVFRAEVLCRDLEIKLAAEETTRFYDNGMAGQRPASSVMAAGSQDIEPVR